MNNEQFKQLLRQKGEELYRPMHWREDTRPYYVLVSELMLQQTQVSRVMPKFDAFLERFPDERALADASLADVLKLWQGLGYNRRAKFLHEAAKMIVSDFGGVFPNNEKDLMKLPGVGRNTAGAICAYAFNQPAIFIETNIRTVYIHHFFGDSLDVDDKEIAALLEQTLDRNDPRAFYWALMDYGSYLKEQGIRNVSSSKHYKKQSTLKGSLRETRGAIIRELVRADRTEAELKQLVMMPDRFSHALNDLVSESMVIQSGIYFHLTK